MKIFEDFFDEDSNAPCKNCKNYDDGEVNEYGADYHEFMCSGYQCLYCAQLRKFDCFEPIE